MSHIYRGDFANPEEPMCPRGWNRQGGTAFSIWRNNVGKGVCKNCLRNTLKQIEEDRKQ